MSRIFLVVIGLIAFALAWNPPKLVGLFAQKGVYAIAAASFVPILFGVLVKNTIPVWLVSISALIGFFGHLFLNIFGGHINPSVSSSMAMIASFIFALIGYVIHQQFAKNKTLLVKHDKLNQY